MPKRKRTTALFEVMSTGKPMEPLIRSRSVFQSPSLWSVLKKLVPEKKPRARAAEQEFAPPTHRVIEPEPAYEPEPEPVAVAEVDRTPREPWLNLERFKFKWDVTNSIIAGSAVVIVVGLAGLIEHKFRHTPLPTLSAVSTSDLQKQPAHPGVLNIPRRASTPASVLPPVAQVAPPKDSTDVASPTPATPSKRIINMNYVLVQIYDDGKVAQSAADLLNSKGVECTVIQGLPRWAANPKWYCIVGTKGFGPRTTGTSEFEAYMQKIRDVSTTFAGRSKWKQFNPQLYRWGADSEK